MGADKAGKDSVVRRMRAGIADAVRAGGRLAEQRPSALAAFLAAAAFAPFLAPGSGEVAVLLNQLGGLGSGYLAAVLTSAAERGRPEDLADEIETGLEAAGEQGAGLRAELSQALREIGAVQAAIAADPLIAGGLAELSGHLSEFGWMLGDTAERLAQLVGQGVRHGNELQAARAELGALTALLQRVVQAQDAQARHDQAQHDQAQHDQAQHDQAQHDREGRAPAEPAQCPYPGMRQFESGDAARFFGREELTAHLIARLAEQLRADTPLLVFGSSGAGKSSLLRAGLIPALRRGRLLPIAGSAKWPRILVDRLGADPLAALTAAMGGGPVADENDDPAVVAEGLGPQGRFVLVVDQFEEVFTQCADSEKRVRFVRVLLALASRGLVVLGVRADFYQHCASLADLGGLLADNQVVVGALAEDDLRRAITLPAIQFGCTVEPGLAELMIADLGLRPGLGSMPGVAGYEPGALPLLAYALRATWDRRLGNTLTVAGYREAGGIHGAVAAEAERICADLPAGGVDAARRIMLRLVSVGREGQLTRRRVPRADLLAGLDHPEPAASPETPSSETPSPGLGTTVLARFTHARLVTADEDGVEITHEAFLTAWPRLANWITEDRDGLRLHRQLGEHARAWAQEDRDASGLYRGIRLSGAIAWRAANETELTTLERSFLDAGAAAEHAVRHAERRQNRRLRTLAGGLTVVLILALGASGVAVGQQRRAARQSAQDLSGQFAAQSDTALTVNLRTADLDALAGWQADHTGNSLSSLLSRQVDPYLGTFSEPARDTALAVAVSPSGKLLAVAEAPGFSTKAEAQSSIQLWNLASHRLVATFPQLGSTVHTLAFSPDGRTLAAIVDSTPNLRFWDVATGKRVPDRFPEPGKFTSSFSYSPRGHLIAIATAPVTPAPGQTLETSPSAIQIWNTVSHRPVHKISGLTSDLSALSFSPNGHLLVSGSYDGHVRLWNPRTGTLRAELAHGLGQVSSVLFSPDGRHVAMSAQQFVLLRALQPAGSLTVAFSTVGSTPGLAFGPQGRFLYAATGPGGGLGSYDVLHQARVSPDYELPAPVAVLAASGGVLAAAGPNGSLFAFDTGGALTLPKLDSGGLSTVAAAPHGRLVATGAADGIVQLWRPGDPAAAQVLSGEDADVQSLAFSADGRLLAAIYQNCDVVVWPAGGTGPPVRLPSPAGPIQAAPNTISADVAFVPGQHTMITGCSYEAVSGGRVNEIFLRDTRNWLGSSLTLPRLARDQQAISLAASPTGNLVAVDTGTGLVLLVRPTTGQVMSRITTGQGKGEPTIAFSPDGRLLATANTADITGTVKLWQVATRKQFRHLGPGTSQVRSLAFSPDGRTLAISSQDATVRLWNVAKHRLTESLAAFPSVLGTQTSPTSVNRVAFVSGNRLVTATNDGKAVVWDLDPAHETHRLCAILGRSSVADWWGQQNPPPGRDPCNG